MTNTDKILGNISAIQTLIKNFPMGILDDAHRKNYTSAYDLIIDIFNACGIDLTDILYDILSDFYEIPFNNTKNLKAVYEGIDSGLIKIEEQNAFMESLEISIKKILESLLASIFTCSAIPVIPTKYMDNNNMGQFIVPKNAMDILGMLDISPSSKEGRLYYYTDGTTTFYKRTENISEDGNTSYNYVKCEYSDIEEDDINNIKNMSYVPTAVTINSPLYISVYKGCNPNLLYRTYDMNAFLWYVLNRGNDNSDLEYNHMMWDSRVYAAKKGYSFETSEEWNKWYESNLEDGNFKSENIDEDYLFPILQLNRTNGGVSVKFSSQKYYKTALEGRGNSSIYAFNRDYLNSIQILHPKIILKGMIESLMGTTLKSTSSLSVTKTIIEAKLSSAIKNIIEADDMEIEDCYTSFSNEEFDAMLNEMMLQRYGAKKYNGDVNKASKIDIESYIRAIDSISSNATSEGTVSTITKLVTNVSVKEGSEGSIEYGLETSLNRGILYQILWSMTLPIVESLFTPEVLFLLLINYNLYGMVSFDDIYQDTSKILNLLMNKILGLMKSIVIYIKDKIIERLLYYLFKYILPNLEKWQALRLLESLTSWLELLTEAASCVPTFGLRRRRKINAPIDDVRYADIDNTLITPETNNSC